MSFVDAHCHLVAAEFKYDIEDIIEKAKQVEITISDHAGVVAALVVAVGISDFKEILDLADRFPEFVLPCLGLHPVQGDPLEGQRSIRLEELDAAVPLIEKYHDRLGAIGEVGLDFSPRLCPHEDDKDNQRTSLIRQIELAKKYDLPINVHSRSAGRPTIALLKEQGVKKAVLHAFDGRASVAMEGVKEGYYFSIPPSIARDEQTQKLVQRLPIENLLLETDSPSLSPVKQERNEPANVSVSCDFIAKIKKLEPGDVMRITTENSIRLFPKLKRFFMR